MLNQVPKTINRSNRIVVLKHPNAMDCTVLRKKLLRTTYLGDGGTLGGIPTLGGAGVLSKEDESDVTYEYVTGDEYTSQGRILNCGIYEPQTHADADLTNNGDFLEQGAMIEALIESIGEGEFTADKDDLIAVTLGGGIIIVYEVKGVTGTVNIPPFTRKLVLQARDDLDHIPQIATSTHDLIA